MRPKLARRNEPEYFVRLPNQATEEGPFTLEVLREKARNGDIIKETWFRVSEATEYRQLREDGPLTADLWPEPDPFYPPEAEVVPASADIGASGASSDRTNHSPSLAELEPVHGSDWTTLLRFKWLALRWGLAIGLIIWGIRLWQAAGEDPADGFKGLIPIGMAGLLIAFDLTRILASPLTLLVDTLTGGGGGGKTVDYWTADSLLAQGEYRLAAAEYRRIVLEYPRELQAYLKGIRAARAQKNQKEADRFHDLAMKNLKSEQDRNLFLSSLDRIDEK